jgi:hypothetical protein
MKIALYRKAIVATLTAGLLATQVALTDGTGISGSEWVTVALAVLGAVAVYWVPNDKFPEDTTTEGE